MRSRPRRQVPGKLTSPLTATWLSLLACSLLAACSEAPAPPNALVAELSAPYDYYLTGMLTHRFAADGTLQYRLEAERYTHFPEDDHADLLAPHLFWLAEDAESWQASAERGRLDVKADEDTLQLIGSVDLHNQPEARQFLQIRSDTLLVVPARRLASTTAPATVVTATASLQSIGLQLDLASHRLTLLSDVRGRYAP